METRGKIVPLQLRHVLWTATLMLIAWAVAFIVGFAFFYLTSPIPR